MLKPKILHSFNNYRRKDFIQDLSAGIIVGIVALVLAIAFAIASGVSPEEGIITAIIAGFIISALGGSSVQIGGPTSTCIVIVLAVVKRHGLEGLAVATIMAGLLLIVIGLLRLGSLIKFIPYSVNAGFTSGVALLILSGQIKDFLGLPLQELPSGFFEKWLLYLRKITLLDPASLTIGLLSLVLLFLWPKLKQRIPGPVVVILVSTLAVSFFKIPVATIGSQFGTIAATIPAPSFPSISLNQITPLLSPAFTLAFLIGMEALLSASVADGMIGDHHYPNMELVANGLANVISPLFGGIPATGALVRTATNIANGGRTPVAGVIHSLAILLMALFFSKWVSFFPLPALAAILIHVAFNMGRWRNFHAILKYSRSDAIVLVLTFILTLSFDLAVAILLGLLVAALLSLKSIVQSTTVKEATSSQDKNRHLSEAGISLTPGTVLFTIDGPLFFGTTGLIDEAIATLETSPETLVLNMRNVPLVDVSGLNALRALADKCQRQQINLHLTEIQPQVAKTLIKSSLNTVFSGNPKQFVFSPLSAE